MVYKLIHFHAYNEETDEVQCATIHRVQDEHAISSEASERIITLKYIMHIHTHKNPVGMRQRKKRKEQIVSRTIEAPVKKVIYILIFTLRFVSFFLFFGVQMCVFLDSCSSVGFPFQCAPSATRSYDIYYLLHFYYRESQLLSSYLTNMKLEK